MADDHISIKGENSHAIFNGVQTLLALLSNKSLPAELDQIKISDYPDFEYRGLMVDVARNFTKKDDMLKLIDILAMYKMNVLHLHLTDDEGWRIQIPDIEELTEVGARRGHSKDEAHFLFPAYGSGWDPQNTLSLGNGYYTKQDYIEILRYANARHISIVPEIDLPGHARAAIVAMKARYNKYKDSDPLKAKEYLLSEHADTSKYKSVQSYSDNVINIALPSSYRFIEKVITELAKMHNEAGIELDMIHIGGDEVPKGAWEGSPECKKLMQMLDITDPGSLKDYFVNEVLKITEPQNIRVAGWQEIALKAHKEVVSEKFTNKNILSYCWNTMPGWEADEVPYKLANAGYQVILCNVSNFYFDLAYSPDFLEPGHNWGGYNDEISSFDMQPYNIYQSIRRTTKGLPLNNPIEYTNKELLRKESQKQILGLQGQLFTETIRNFDMVTYYLLPKMLGLAERAWNAEPNWIRTQLGDDYNDAVDLYNTIIAEKEFPKFHRLGYNFRVSRPGLKIIDGMLHANSKIPQSQIRFTTDGSEPDLQSQEWTKPIPCISHIVKAKVFYYGKESNTTIWKNKHINN